MARPHRFSSLAFQFAQAQGQHFEREHHRHFKQRAHGQHRNAALQIIRHGLGWNVQYVISIASGGTAQLGSHHSSLGTSNARNIKQRCD